MSSFQITDIDTDTGKKICPETKLHLDGVLYLSIPTGLGSCLYTDAHLGHTSEALWPL